MVDADPPVAAKAANGLSFTGFGKSLSVSGATGIAAVLAVVLAGMVYLDFRRGAEHQTLAARIDAAHESIAAVRDSAECANWLKFTESLARDRDRVVLPASCAKLAIDIAQLRVAPTPTVVPRRAPP